MPNSKLADMLSRAGARMASELKDRLVPHPGEQGVAREEIIRQFLRTHLPKGFDISSGFVFDVNGEVSQQADIIIADSLVSPRFEVSGGVRFYPCESVVAVGQVKSKVTSRKELWDAFCNLRSVGLLDRTAGGRAVCERTGNPLDHKSNHQHRIFSFIFVIDRALSAELAQETLLECIHRSGPHLWPNMIFALNKYMITYCCDNGVCPNTLDARATAIIRSIIPGDDLIRFYTFLSQAINHTSISRVSSWAHLEKAVPLDAELMYSSVDAPPPYLSSLEMFDWGTPYDDSDDEELAGE